MSQENFDLESKNYQFDLKLFNPIKFRLDCTEAQFSFIVIYTISIISPGLWSKMVCQIKTILKKTHLIIVFQGSPIKY
jgi:hypothetical protein